MEKPSWEKVKTLCLSAVICLMIPVIIINSILIFNTYIMKEEVPDICGYYPVICLTDEASPWIEEGELLFCRKVDPDGINEGEMVAFFAEGSRDAMYIQEVTSVDGDSVTVRTPGGGSTFALPAEDVIGKLRFSIRYLGYIMYFLSTVPGFLLCVVIPTVVITEIYLYRRRKDAETAEDEEMVLLAELEKLKAERENLLSQLEVQQPGDSAAEQTASAEE